MPGHGLAADGWQEAGSGAVAILPVPTAANGITGGSLVCAEQRWTLRLRAEPREDRTAAVRARLAIDERLYPVLAERGETVIAVPVSYDMIEALKSGARLTVELGTGEAGATFSLSGSRKVLEAAQPRCSPVDMSAYEKLTITGADPAVGLAEPLLEKEIKLFRAATSATPGIAAGRLDRGGGRELLFATVCGSSWYYGRSGCTLFGYKRGGVSEDWREVYNSEGVDLYVDPGASHGGWPDLLTLQPAGGIEPMRWIWAGERYELRDPQFAADDMPDHNMP